MLSARSRAITRHEWRSLLRNPGVFLQIVLMPMGFMAFLKPAFREALQAEGYAGATGAEHAVPGMTVMFAFFFVNIVSFGFVREHGFGTWERLRASPATPLQIMDGKCAVPFFMMSVQQTVLLLFAGLVFGLTITGSIVGLFLVGVALAAMLLTLGLAMAALVRSAEQLNILSSLMAIGFSGLGGAFTPLSVLPGWARAIAPISPGYWAMQGYRAVILDGAGVTGVVRPVLALLGFALAFGVVAALRFRFEETKLAYA